MTIDSIRDRQKLRRKVTGIAAALLPYSSEGMIAVEAFQQHLVSTQRAGLMNAVNMDTGYVNYLSASEKQDVLRWTREALGKDTFVAGAYIEGEAGDIVALYRRAKRSRFMRLCAKDTRVFWRLNSVTYSRQTGRSSTMRR